MLMCSERASEIAIVAKNQKHLLRLRQTLSYRQQGNGHPRPQRIHGTGFCLLSHGLERGPKVNTLTAALLEPEQMTQLS